MLAFDLVGCLVCCTYVLQWFVRFLFKSLGDGLLCWWFGACGAAGCLVCSYCMMVLGISLRSGIGVARGRLWMFVYWYFCSCCLFGLCV